MPHGAEAFGSAVEGHDQNDHTLYTLQGGGYCGTFVPAGFSFEWNANGTRFSSLQLDRLGTPGPVPPVPPPPPGG
eukprot:SAG22_NODE_554_length_9135_cov_3.635569_2_plen_75_part_00